MISENELTVPEQGVLAAFRVGGAGVDVKGAEIRGDFLRGLFLGKYDKQADYRGTYIANAIVSRVLDMEFRETEFPLRFRDCSFERKIKLQQLTCPELDFRGCILKESVVAADVKVGGNVILAKVNAMGYVLLSGAVIGGEITCTHGSFQNKTDVAINCQNIKVGADVFLDGEFNAVGELNLMGAHIGGQLDCSGGNFLNAKGNALNAQGIEVAEAVFLRKGFKSEGAVNLRNAVVGGEFDCTDGDFQNENGHAIDAQNMRVADSVSLRGFFNGGVNLLGARISGQLNCTGGRFQHEGKISLVAQSVKVDSDVLLSSYKMGKEERKFSANGLVLFTNATIGGSFLLNSCKLAHLSLSGANVLGEFLDDSGIYKDSNGDSIDLNIDGFRYQRMNVSKEREKDRLEWVGLMSKGDEFRPQPYEQLMEVYREMGHMNWARRVGFELEKKRHKQLRLNRDHKRFVVLGWAWWFWYWILRVTIGYGYKPFRAITRWFTPLVVAGLVLFGGMLPCPDPCRVGSEACHCMVPSDAEVLLSEDWKVDGKLPKDYPGFNPFYYAVETALPVLPLGQTENWHPKTPWVRWLQGAITIIGALILTILASYGVGVLGPRWKDE